MEQFFVDYRKIWKFKNSGEKNKKVMIFQQKKFVLPCNTCLFHAPPECWIQMIPDVFIIPLYV